MNNRITQEEEKLIVENMRLVGHVVNKLGINHSNYNYEDLIQIGYIGLIKAAKTFDSNIAKFTSYACICIRNEIFMALRKEWNIPNLISIEECTSDKVANSGLTYEEIIEDKEAEFSDVIINRESLKKVLSLILNCFTIKDKIIFLYGISGMSQQEISPIVNLTQSSISRAQKRMQRTLKQLIDNENIYETKYEVEVLDGKFIIKYRVFDIEDLNLLLNNLENEMKSENTKYIFCFRCEENELIMEFPIDFDSCYVIGKVIQVIEKYD